MLSRIYLLALLLAVAACDDRTRQAMGDVNAVIVVADDSLWAEVEETYLTRLQPTVFAVRDEPTFRVTQTSVEAPYWSDLRRFRQLVAMGGPGDSWVDDALRRSGVAAPEPPAVIEAEDVWARNQRVTVVLLPADRPADAARAMADSLASVLDDRYRRYVINRMYTSGVNRELADSLMARDGFAVDMPNVYRWRRMADSVFLFINDQPDPAQLARFLLVTWRTGTAGDPSLAETLDWRDAMADRFYEWNHVTERDRLQTTPVAGPAAGGIEVRGIWIADEEFPGAGPFISRVVDCPDQDRRYLVDTWLYAPGRSKYQYMLQLETLLGTFRCGG